MSPLFGHAGARQTYPIFEHLNIATCSGLTSSFKCSLSS